MTAEELAKKLHETYNVLAPSLGRRPKAPWDEIDDATKNLLTAASSVVLVTIEKEDRSEAIRAYMDKAQTLDPQGLAYDRNAWQRRLGVLLNLLESELLSDSTLSQWDARELLERVYTVVNTNPSNGRIDEPYADVAAMTVRCTIESALAAGLVVPGPKAPSWMTNEQSER